MPGIQSAYRRGQSTETAMLKVISDVLLAADSEQMTLLGLLDLSAAFDTVDHNILISRLHHAFGIQGLANHGLSPLSPKERKQSASPVASRQCHWSHAAYRRAVSSDLCCSCCKLLMCSPLFVDTAR